MTRQPSTTREAQASLATTQAYILARQERDRQEARSATVIAFPGRYTQAPCDGEG